jgi:hypothetical protein
MSSRRYAVVPKIKFTLDDEARADPLRCAKIFVDVDPWFPICEAVIAGARPRTSARAYYLAATLSIRSVL